MGEYWIQVMAGLTIAFFVAVISLGTRLAKRHVNRSEAAGRVMGWWQDIWAYMRRGFRWVAVLDVDHAEKVARVVICKRMPPGPTEGSDVFRPRYWAGRAMQTQRAFAQQVYRATVEWCAGNGWDTIEFTDFTPPDAVVWPGQTTWVVKLANADNQMCVVITPGWCPIPPLSEKQVIDNSLTRQLETMLSRH